MKTLVTCLGLPSIMFFVVLTQPAAQAAQSVPDGYRQIAEESGVPATLLYAIALTESGTTTTDIRRPWPWTLNIAGNGQWYPTRKQAWRALNGALAQGTRSIDIGLMQVNWHYHRARLGTPWQALDPYHNLRTGARILSECHGKHRDWWASTGCYHAPSHPGRARLYQERVKDQWRTVTGSVPS